MNNPQEFTALQIMVLVRTDQGGGKTVQTTFDSSQFQYHVQDALGDLFKTQLRQAEVDFREVIISMDAPSQRAKKVEKKSSFLGRILGKE